MKKYFWIFIFLPFIFAASIQDMQKSVIARKNVVTGEVERFFEADWTSAGATDEICSSTPCPDTWDELSDSPGFLSVSSDQLLLSVTSDTTGGVVRLNGSTDEVLYGFSATEWWLEFTFELSQVSNYESSGTMKLSSIRHNQPALTESDLFTIAMSSGSISTITGEYRHDSGESAICASPVAISLSAATPYTARYHHKSATGPGANDGEAHMTIVGQMTTCAQTEVDSDTVSQLIRVNIGNVLPAHDGSNNSTIKYDNFKLYTSDPGWSW